MKFYKLLKTLEYLMPLINVTFYICVFCILIGILLSIPSKRK